MSEMTGADLVARRLALAGAKRAFGIPGGEVLALVDALERAGITTTLARHENAAGFMAEGFWHATGTVPILFATLGPGAANAANVVANAMQDRVPLIVLTGCVDAALAESYTHQVFDHRALFAGITKASLRAARGTEDVVIDKALAIAMRGRPGPVHIDLPIDVMEARSPSRAVSVTLPITRSVPDVSAAVALIARAKKPLFLAGLDVVNEGASAALEALVRKSNAALMTTYKAKGTVDEARPEVIGGIGLSPRADRIIKPALDGADLIVLAGYDPIEMRAGWRHPFPVGIPVIDIVAEAMPHGMHRADHVLEGPVAATMNAITAALPQRPPEAPFAEVRSAFRAAFAPGDVWGPGLAYAILAEHAPANTVVTVDSGAHRILLSQQWQARAPRSLLQSSGLCTMGCALPLATGHALGAPDTPVLCVVGDGCLEMVLGELATLRDLNVPVVIAVMVDGSLGLIEMKQRGMQLPNHAVDFGRTDFASIARAFGGNAFSVRDAPGLSAAAAEAFAAKDSFSLVAIEIERRAYDGAF